MRAEFHETPPTWCAAASAAVSAFCLPSSELSSPPSSPSARSSSVSSSSTAAAAAAASVCGEDGDGGGRGGDDDDDDDDDTFDTSITDFACDPSQEERRVCSLVRFGTVAAGGPLEAPWGRPETPTRARARMEALLMYRHYLCRSIVFENLQTLHLFNPPW